jgi:hypothetical protein
MSPNAMKETRLDLLIRLDRLLAEADAVRTLRDRLLAEARDGLPAERPEGRRKERRDA